MRRTRVTMNARGVDELQQDHNAYQLCTGHGPIRKWRRLMGESSGYPTEPKNVQAKTGRRG
jgi:hypothetical protein